MILMNITLVAGRRRDDERKNYSWHKWKKRKREKMKRKTVINQRKNGEEKKKMWREKIKLYFNFFYPKIKKINKMCDSFFIYVKFFRTCGN